MGFSRAELLAHRDEMIPDLIGPRCRLLFVGINPGLWSAATGAHFARPGNRFYPALYRAGITEEVIDAAAGMSVADRDELIGKGIGITNVVARATATAAELTPAELRAGGVRLREVVARESPAVVAILGITAYRTAFGQRQAVTGRQPDSPADWGAAQLWVVPNPSGLNAHESIDSLAASYRLVAQAASVIIR